MSSTKGKKKASPAAPASAIKSSLPPGFQASSSATPTPAASADEHQARILRHRALYIFRFYVGRNVEVTLRDKSKYSGVLHCIDPDEFTVVLKNTQRLTEDPSSPFNNGSTFVIQHFLLAHLTSQGRSEYHQDAGVAQRLPYNSGTFQTDTDISNNLKAHLFGRELQAASSWLDPTLDSGDLERGSNKNWNQFEVNEKLFGVTSTYDENIYTTKLEKAKMTQAQVRAAEKMAREIESQTSSNFHLLEERNAATGRDEIDEETRYSSVVRSGPNSTEKPSAWQRGSNAYVPPALRTKQDAAPKAKSPAHAAAPAKSPINAPSTSPKEPVKNPESPKKPESPKEPEPIKKPDSPKKPASPTAPAPTAAAAPKEEPKAPAKKGLNPLAKEFKLNASAAAFTPSRSYAPPPVQQPPPTYPPQDGYYEGDDEMPPYVNQYGMPMMMQPPMYPPPMYSGNGGYAMPPPPPYHGYHPPPYDKDHRPYAQPPLPR